MEFDNAFEVAAPIDEVWSAMLDVERVAPCVPGARVIERTGDNAYKVGIKIKLGPMSMTYTGNVEITESDPEAHRALMTASAKEQRGQGTAQATVELRLAEAGAGATSGTMHSEVAMSGRAAAMGQGVISDVSARMIDTFATNLAAMLAGQPAPEPVGATTNGGGAASATAERPAPAPAPPQEADALEIGSVAGDVAAARLAEPRTLAAVLALVAFIFYRLGKRSGRHT